MEGRTENRRQESVSQLAAAKSDRNGSRREDVKVREPSGASSMLVDGVGVGRPSICGSSQELDAWCCREREVDIVKGALLHNVPDVVVDQESRQFYFCVSITTPILEAHLNMWRARAR